MNKEKVYIEGYIVGLFKETTFEEIGHRIQLANGDIVDIDNRFVHKSIEPEKVKIPQFVADWIEVAKTVYSLTGGMTYGGPGVNKWLENEDNQRTFALAWFDGYEVLRRCSDGKKKLYYFYQAFKKNKRFSRFL